MEASLIFFTGLFCSALTIFGAILTVMEFKSLKQEKVKDKKK
jgi:hypothetical protein